MFKEITDTEYPEVLGQGMAILLFHKERCPYCNAMKKILTKFNDRPAAQGKDITYLSMDREKNPETVAALNVTGVPALFIFKNGEKIAEKSGDITYRQLEKLIA